MKSTKSNLSEWLSWLETSHPKFIDLGLERLQSIVKENQWHQFSCPIITVGGTNGKGSCVAMLDAILRAQGYKVGTYTSPHLFHYNERICINGRMVSDKDLCEAFQIVEKARAERPLSYFEFGTLAALYLFQQAALDVVILEVGLGGRLDAVNIVDADVAVISTIDLDHCKWLGFDRESIGFEKAGIFRANRIAVCGDPQPPQSLLNQAVTLNTHLFVQNRDFSYVELAETTWKWWSHSQTYNDLPKPNLSLQNASTVLMALEALKGRLPVTLEALHHGLSHVFLAGRFETVQQGGATVIFDVAHNPQSVGELARRLKNLPEPKRCIAVFSMLADKDIGNSLKLIADEMAAWKIAPLHVERGCTATQLQQVFEGLSDAQYEIYPDIADAYQSALRECQKSSEKIKNYIIVFGSFYTVSQAMLQCPHFLDRWIKAG